MFLADFIFAVSHLKMHPAVRLNTLKALTTLYTKRKLYWKFISFHFSYVLTRVKIYKMVSCVAHGYTHRADKTSNIIALVTIIIMLL